MPVDMIGLILFAGAMIGTPGPANMVVMASGARFGFRASLPFLSGVVLGKQVIIWPLGLGLLSVLAPDSIGFQLLRWASVAYILYLAWRIAGTRIVAREAGAAPPSFANGLVVHPMNPKAWAMLLGSYTNFTDPDGAAFTVTAIVAATTLGLQVVLQSFWTYAGQKVAETVAGTSAEGWLMRALALAMIISVFLALR